MVFDESKHPRDKNGQFTDKSYSDMSSAELKEKLAHPQEDIALGVEKERQIAEDRESAEDISSLLGREYKGYKGQAAVNKLIKEQQGHVKGAFYRDDIGDIDLLWGNDYLGLQHILLQREKQGIDGTEFVKDLAEVVEKGVFRRKSERGNFEFLHGRKMVIIAPEFHKNKLVFVLTAYKTTIKK